VAFFGAFGSKGTISCGIRLQMKMPLFYLARMTTCISGNWLEIYNKHILCLDSKMVIGYGIEFDMHFDSKDY